MYDRIVPDEIVLEGMEEERRPAHRDVSGEESADTD
jgi:hypothetical protein